MIICQALTYFNYEYDLNLQMLRVSQISRDIYALLNTT